ncbi:hypothetical protein [Paenibacillus contaminans]|uniref:Uncharacterized protein n=1 Tax=Paenibacillus contaminans TaxID=450362 RepID=A0A329M0H7_9BACL|nr:hypothetical protein [Paenibacillus contaminans]RAV12173.1 hypothetical protein DQG23_35215 [Paenibacillus contaminans]
MSKQLTITKLNNEYKKQFGGQKKITLKTGDYLYVQTVFKKTSIQKLILDYQTILEEARTNLSDANVLKDLSFAYYMLLLRHFTNLDNIPIELAPMVAVCEKLIDLDILEDILASFPAEELVKINEQLRLVEENSRSIGEQWGEMMAAAAGNKTNRGNQNE